MTPTTFLVFLSISWFFVTRREEILKLVIFSIADKAVAFSDIQTGFFVAIFMIFFLYKLLENLEKNNLNIIINTSFNIAGDPIVFDYIDCYTNMKRMNLKYLVTDKGLFERL